MKLLIIFVAIVSLALAVPVDESKDAQILKYDNDNIGVDGYKYAFETSDGISKSETGELINAGTDDEAIVVRGQYSYVFEGKTYNVNYVADVNGFQPEGDHIPKAI